MVTKPYSLERALAAMAGCKALVVGDLVLDVYLFGETQRVSREAPVLVVREERSEGRLGGAANTAANLASLGLKVDLVGLVGRDEQGKMMARLITEAGCSSDGLIHSERPTVRKTRIMAGAFGTARQQVLRLDNEPRDPLQKDVVAAVAERLWRLGCAADVVVVSDYGHGLVQEVVVDVLTKLRNRGIAVCVDSRHNLRAFTGMTALTPNIPEAEAAVGYALDDDDSVVRCGRALVDDLDCEACLITQGRGGMTLFRRDTLPEHMPVVGPAEVTDVTGAGDSVVATLGAALAAGLGLRNGMRLATCAAGVVVNRVGCACASPADVLAAAQAGGVQLEPWHNHV